MKIDLDDAGELTALQRFQHARLHAGRLATLAGRVGTAATTFVVGNWFTPPASVLSTLLCNGIASIFLMLAGLQSAYWVARWRCNAIGEPVPPLQAFLQRTRQVVSAIFRPPAPRDASAITETALVADKRDGRPPLISV